MAGPVLTTRARAKINLNLTVLGRQQDGYHALESLVAFAGVGDELGLTTAGGLSLTISGPMSAGLEASDGNLVMRAARKLAEAVPGLRLGAFHLVKRLPVASGIGGGSADAAAALRLLARANGLAADDARLFAVARQVGADVPVCLMRRTMMMRGVGEALEPVALPKLAALLVNPGVGLSTAAVFGELGLARGENLAAAQLAPEASPRKGEGRVGVDLGSARINPHPPLRGDLPLSGGGDNRSFAGDLDRRLSALTNDLEPPALRLAPVIGDVLAALRAANGCRFTRMSGSGATCFALFDDGRASAAAARLLKRQHPGWWIRSTVLG